MFISKFAQILVKRVILVEIISGIIGGFKNNFRKE